MYTTAVGTQLAQSATLTCDRENRTVSLYTLTLLTPVPSLFNLGGMFGLPQVVVECYKYI